MKRSGHFILAMVVILVLTGLLRNGLQPRTARLDAMQQALENFERAQHLLRRDMISVRSGLLQSFDPLVEDVDALQAAMRSLEALSQSPENRPLIIRLKVSAQRQESLTETLKTDSALLQNSLAYFSTLSSNAEPFDRGDLEAGRLSGAMLRLTLNTSPDTQAMVDRRIADFAVRLEGAPEDREARAVLLSHARLLRRLLPQTDTRLAALLAEDDVSARAQLRAWIAQERRAAETTAQYYRYGLYVAAVLLTLIIANLALKLAAHLAILRRRSAFKRELAEISAEIVAAHPEEVKARYDQALARLAAHLQADAAFLFGEGDYACARIWPSTIQAQDADWSPSAHALAKAAQLQRGGVFHDHVDWPWTAPGVGRAIRAHVVAVVVVNEHADYCVLGFARFEGEVQAQAAELDVIRLALDVLAGAVRRTRAEQQRSALETRLQHAGRMEAIGAFASGIAHNFNNILGAIAGYAEMAGTGPDTPPAIARYVDEIGVAVMRARRLVDQILVYGGRSGPPPQHIDLGDLLAESVSLLGAAHGPAAAFVIESKDGDYGVLGDPERLQQIILNLASNAVQAMEGGGSVRLALERRQNRAPVELTSGVLLAGDYVVLRVADDGAGMSATTLARIFEPFFTTRAEGNGLGLATTAETARDLGGAISVQSAPGEGAVFEVWLPGEGQAPSSAPSLSGRGETVLLVAPDHEQLRQEEEQIAALGYEPVGFVQIERALSSLQAWPNRFDAMVLRTQDPDAAKALRKTAPDLGLVILADATLRSATPLSALAISLGNCSLVSWPPIASDLSRALAQAVSQSCAQTFPAGGGKDRQPVHGLSRP